MLRLGTRGSRLALAQCAIAADALARLGVEAESCPIKTSGDRMHNVALGDFGGKALFVKEIEEALLDGRVDVGVHSLKDMPAALPAGLELVAFLSREDARDVLVTRDGGGLDDLAKGAVVGSSSLRRRVLLLARRPDLRVEPIRGNVETRLAKLASGQYDAIVVARAGLVRLGIAPAHAVALPVEDFLPAAGQGVIGLEARTGDVATVALLKRVDDPGTRAEAEAERGFLRRLGAGCHTPVASYARLLGAQLSLTALVADPDAATVLRASVEGPAAAAEALGVKLADELIGRGARALISGASPP
jgi:hydroxymethylbilane synthase